MKGKVRTTTPRATYRSVKNLFPSTGAMGRLVLRNKTPVSTGSRLSLGSRTPSSTITRRPSGGGPSGGPQFNGTFKRVQWVKGRKTAAKRRWGKFVSKVRTATNSDVNKAHFLVHRTVRIESLINRCGWSEITYNTNIDLREARRNCIFNTGALAQPYDLEKLRVLNVVVDIAITNPTNVCTYVDMWEVVPKGPQQGTAGLTPLTWLTEIENNYDNSSQGASNSAFAGTVGQVGASFYHLPAFWQKWVALKRTRMLLQPGECSTRQIRMPRDWVWNPQSSTLNGVESTLTTYNKMTRFIVFQIWGQPINSQATKTDIAYSATALNIAYHVDYTIAQVPQFRQSATTNAVPSNVWVRQALPTITDGQVVDMLNSTIEAVARA